MGTKNIILNLSSPEKALSGVEVQRVTLPGENGRFTVLSGHAPIISTLAEGDILYTAADGKETVQHIKSGFVEVRDNIVSVSAEMQ